VTFFFDNCISKAIPRILTELDVDACHLTQHFPADTNDTEWIPWVGYRGWIVVTVDNEIKRNTPEREALRSADIVAFFFGRWFLDRQKWDQATWIVKHWRAIETHARSAQTGTIISINRRCQFTRDFA
jgi:hypothetical protein